MAHIVASAPNVRRLNPPVSAPNYSSKNHIIVNGQLYDRMTFTKVPLPAPDRVKRPKLRVPEQHPMDNAASWRDGPKLTRFDKMALSFLRTKEQFEENLKYQDRLAAGAPGQQSISEPGIHFHRPINPSQGGGIPQTPLAPTGAANSFATPQVITNNFHTHHKEEVHHHHQNVTNFKSIEKKYIDRTTHRQDLTHNLQQVDARQIHQTAVDARQLHQTAVDARQLHQTAVDARTFQQTANIDARNQNLHQMANVDARQLTFVSPNPSHYTYSQNPTFSPVGDSHALEGIAAPPQIEFPQDQIVPGQMVLFNGQEISAPNAGSSYESPSAAGSSSMRQRKGKSPEPESSLVLYDEPFRRTPSPLSKGKKRKGG